ncbi:PIR Superfamily Protein [Plasmodium ovale wallikeri]|uniref:PIR Superfamily Protein n=1 Tax=Plasmodium ovale wallikeri TaxID=864142 RepID=A0A1A9AHD8_PLAOA|nr:PIR Superfamily Protein [Plasmodium ovale wallikeri]SBT58844.1 PIR Superfamily Protein [Plasmodium ovale wallikeri]
MNFYLYRIYKNFSEIYDYNKNENSVCNSYIEENSEPFGNIHNVCKNIDNIFKNIFSTNYRLDTVDKYCEYLSYFIHDKIKNFPTTNNFDKLYEALIAAKDNHNFENDNCDIINFYSKKGEFDKMKELYFRSEILQEIKNNYAKISVDDVSFYKTYISESANFYNEKVMPNFCNYDEYYKKILKKFSHNFDETKNFLKGNRIEISDVNALSAIPTCELGEKDATLAQEGSSGPHGLGQDVHNPGIQSPDMETSGTPEHGKNNIAGIVSGILIGISSLFFTIYKKTKEKFNIEVKSDEFLLEASDNESMDLYNSMYNIQYHSSQNV